jgi:hypothetical protein
MPPLLIVSCGFASNVANTDGRPSVTDHPAALYALAVETDMNTIVA